MGHPLGLQQIRVCTYHEVDVAGAIMCVWLRDVLLVQGGLSDIGTKWYFSKNIDIFFHSRGWPG